MQPTTTKYLDAVLQTELAKNDAEIARLLDVSRPTVSRWRKGECAPSAADAWRIERLLKMPEGVLMAECEAERAKDEATRAAWLRVARWCRRQTANGTHIALNAVATVVLCAPLLIFSQPVQALTKNQETECTLRRLRRLVRKMQAALQQSRKAFFGSAAPGMA